MFADHSYVRLTDGSLFCVAGNTHTAKEVLGCLYYVPPGDPLLAALPTGLGTPIEPGDPVKVGPVVKAGPSRFRSELEAKGIRSWGTTHLQAVQISRIAECFDPRKSLRRLLAEPHQHECRQETLARFVELAVANGVPQDRLGITGSACFDDVRMCDARDLDLVLHPPLDMRQLCAATAEIFTPLAGLDAGDGRRRAYIRARLPAAAGDGRRVRDLVGRRFDVGWIGNTQIDLTEVRDDVARTLQWIFDAEPVGLRTIVGTVDAFDRGYPFTLRLRDSDTTVHVTRRGWQGVLRSGDRIKVRGTDHRDGHTTTMVVDDIAEHDIKIIDSERCAT